MRAWILLSGVLICKAIAPDQELSILNVALVVIASFGGLAMDLTEFFTRNKES